MAESKKKDASTMAKGSIMAVVVTALIAFPVGYVTGNTAADDSDDTTMSESHDDSSHSHAHTETYEVADKGAPIPEIGLNVVVDEKGGWNVYLDVENFTFTPEAVNMDHVDNEGHAHLWIDGEKVARLYGPAYYIEHLDEGEHEIAVTLNTNSHADYTFNGERIEASMTVFDAHHLKDHDHSDGTKHTDGDDHSDHSDEHSEDSDHGHSHSQ